MTDPQFTNLHDIGLDYARTLQIWREPFLQRLQEVRRDKPDCRLQPQG